MDKLQQTELLMEEIGPAVEIVNAVEQLDEGMWGVACLDDQIEILVEFDEETEQLTFHAEHGTPSDEHLLRTYETMLIYNALGRDSGGIRMALDGESGEVIQECDVVTSELDLGGLQSNLENFVAKAIVWQGLLSAGGVSAVGESPDKLATEAAGSDPLTVRV